tara:strand:+ start:1768 stop:2637 length:870 start_codon:yes stop_codon:yes gene_type:complete
MASGPTNVIIREGISTTADPDEAILKQIMEDNPHFTRQDAQVFMDSKVFPETRMGQILGYDLDPGRMLPGTSTTGGQPYMGQPTQGKMWRSADVLDYVRDLWDNDKSKFHKLAQGLLIEGFITGINDIEELYEFDTVINGIGAAIFDVTSTAQDFGLEPREFVADEGMDYVPTLEGRFAETNFSRFESKLDEIVGQAIEIPDPDLLRQLFDKESRSQLGFNISKTEPDKWRSFLRGYRAAAREHKDKGQEINPGAHVSSEIRRMAPESAAFEKRRQYVTYAASLLDSAT